MSVISKSEDTRHNWGDIKMIKYTMGVVVSAYKQWWFKVNTKPIRLHSLDGAEFPYIIKVKYFVDGKEYTKIKWISTNYIVPAVDSTVKVQYEENNPKKAEILCYERGRL